MKKAKKTPIYNDAIPASTIVVSFKDPLETISSSQSSCEIRFGPKTTELTVKVYNDDVGSAVNEAIKNFERAMKKVKAIDKKYRDKP